MIIFIDKLSIYWFFNLKDILVIEYYINPPSSFFLYYFHRIIKLNVPQIEILCVKDRCETNIAWRAFNHGYRILHFINFIFPTYKLKILYLYCVLIIFWWILCSGWSHQKIIFQFNLLRQLKFFTVFALFIFVLCRSF